MQQALAWALPLTLLSSRNAWVHAPHCHILCGRAWGKFWNPEGTGISGVHQDSCSMKRPRSLSSRNRLRQPDPRPSARSRQSADSVQSVIRLPGWPLQGRPGLFEFRSLTRCLPRACLQAGVSYLSHVLDSPKEQRTKGPRAEAEHPPCQLCDSAVSDDALVASDSTKE